MSWAGLGLGGLGPHLVGLRQQGARLLLRVGPLALAALLVGLALGQIGLPADVVDIDHTAVGVEVKDLVDRRFKKTNIVADDHQATLM
ncbi:hypothetical protein GCM10020219_064610 [Nonomuraea dietziae]